MILHRVGIGPDLLLPSMSIIQPQPRDGTVKSLRGYSDTGTRIVSLFCLFRWNVLGNSSLYQDILGYFGLLENNICEVSIYAKDEIYTWGRYNGFAIKPEFDSDAEWNQFFPRNVSIFVRNLVRYGE